MEEGKLVYPELSYKIVGILFGIHNKIGGGHKENYYQKAIAIDLDKSELKFKEQLMTQLKYKDKIIGRYFFDFLIDDKIVLEIKVGERFKKENIDQVYSYLKAKNLKLGIIANFTKHKVRFRRILNLR